MRQVCPGVMHMFAAGSGPCCNDRVWGYGVGAQQLPHQWYAPLDGCNCCALSIVFRRIPACFAAFRMGAAVAASMVCLSRRVQLLRPFRRVPSYSTAFRRGAAVAHLHSVRLSTGATAAPLRLRPYSVDAVAALCSDGMTASGQAIKR